MAMIEGPKHAEVFTKSCTFENSYGQCAVQHRALWNQWWHGWWAQRLGVAHMRCHIQVQSFGNKMYISKLFTVVGYLHMAGFKNCRGTFCAKCSMLVNHKILLQYMGKMGLNAKMPEHCLPMGITSHAVGLNAKMTWCCLMIV